MTRLRRTVQAAVFAAAFLYAAGAASASVMFSFSEVGSDIVMTSSGTLDTTKMVQFGTDGWGGTGIENNAAGQSDIMGGTSFGGNDVTFTFNAGTNLSAWMNPGGPWDSSFGFFGPWTVTAGSKSFATYGFDGSGLRVPGMSMVAADIINGLWTPDQAWIATNQTFASLSMNPGTYTVTDALTGEAITIQIGPGVAVPAPATLPLLLGGFGLLALIRLRRRKAA